MTYKMQLDTNGGVVFDTIARICSEVRIYLNEKGMDILDMDGSHICLVHLHYDKADLQGFLLDAETTLGINVEDLSKLLKRANEDSIGFQNGEDSKILQIIFKNEQNPSRARQYDFDLIDCDRDEVNSESLDTLLQKCPNHVLFVVSEMDTILQDADPISEVLDIQGRNQTITFQANGRVGKYSAIWKDLPIQESKVLSYAIQFLKAIFNKDLCAKWSQTKGELTLGLEDEPLQIKFSFGLKSYLRFCLAPRVEE